VLSVLRVAQVSCNMMTVQPWLLITVNILGGCIYGYNTGVIAGILDDISSEFHLDSLHTGVFTACILFGAAAGSLSGGVVIDNLGRKLGIIILSVIGVVGPIGTAAASSAAGMMVSRAVCGYAVGLATVACPTYVSENAPQDRKGFFGTFFQLAITFSMMVSYIVVVPFTHVHHGYKYLFALGVIPSLILLIIGFIMAESPSWKAGKASAEKEPLVGKQTSGQSGISTLFLRPDARKAFGIGMLLAVTQQLTGINAFMYYATDIFGSAGIKNTIIPTIGLGAWNFVTTLMSTFLVERLGRRPLLLVGTLIMVVSTVIIALAVQLLHGNAVGILTVILLLLFVLGFELGEGPLFWVVATELYTPDVKGTAFSLLNVTTWLCNIMLTFGFLPIKESIGQAGVFWIFSGVGIVCLILMFFVLPETKSQKRVDVLN